MFDNDLVGKYNLILERLNKINFDLLWSGFKPYKFALYNEKEVLIDGKKIEKTDQFVGNTSIIFEGEQIAIWNLEEDEIDIDHLTALIVHEMFHAYQMEQKESRFPNEREAIVKYHYDKENLNIKLIENRLLVELIGKYDQVKFDLFLKYRAYRKSLDLYAFNYEASIEVIEGTAVYVELQALYQISVLKAKMYLEKIVKRIIEPKNFIPIRVISYDVGAIILMIIKKNNIGIIESILDCKITYMDQLLKDIKGIKAEVSDVFDDILKKDEQRLEKIIKRVTKEKPVVSFESTLFMCNIYDVRYYQGYLFSKYFIAYENNNNPVFLNGNFIAKMNDKFEISLIYEWGNDSNENN